MTAAVFLPNWVGDLVMCTPALRSLRHHAGSAGHIIGIGSANAAVLEGTPWLDELWLDDASAGARLPRALRLAARLRSRRCDAALLLVNSRRSARIAWAGGARARVGYARGNGRERYLTASLEPPARDGRFVPASTLDAYLSLAALLGCPDGSRRMELATTAADEAAADTAWRDLGLTSRVITMHAGGAFGPSKRWPEASFARLAARAADVLGATVLFVCGPADEDAARRIVRLARAAGVVSLAGRPLSLGLTKACVRRSRLLVTTDSGPRHIAAAFGVPAVVLFGPTHMAWSETHVASERRLQLALECGPCQQPVCPLEHHRCMRDLSVGQVFDALRELL